MPAEQNHSRIETRPEVLCIGESMVLLAPHHGLPLRNTFEVGLYVAGAESNVAHGLAHLGHETEWFGRVGKDPFGERISDFLSESHVYASNVIVDDSRPTGVYFKDHRCKRSTIYYYRLGSAASALCRTDLGGLHVDRRRLVHLSGITPALSPSCDDLLQAIVVEREQGGAVISFDVNYRPRLWNADTAGRRILELARSADIVFVGRDEAAVLWSTANAEDVRRILPDVPELVVKDAHVGATHFGEAGTTFVPALRVSVVDPVGAGDAFAAGVLSGWLREWDATRSLQLGHIMAGFTLQHVSDLPVLPEAAGILSLAQPSSGEWGDLELVLP